MYYTIYTAIVYYTVPTLGGTPRSIIDYSSTLVLILFTIIVSYQTNKSNIMLIKSVEPFILPIQSSFRPFRDTTSILPRIRIRLFFIIWVVF